MRQIFCPKCDHAIAITDERLKEWKASGEDKLAVVCTQCAHQMNLRLRTKTEEQAEAELAQYGHITVIENSFGYKQHFALRKGINGIGRRNKDTINDIPIVTADPSMERHHAVITVRQHKKTGRLIYALADNDSRVGTFIHGTLLQPREQYNLSDGDVFTLGATSIIFSTAPLPPRDEASLES